MRLAQTNKHTHKTQGRQMQQHTMVPATIVDVSTKIHPDCTQMSTMKHNMMPSIGTEQNMIISTLTRMEIMKIFKIGTFTVILGKRSATDTRFRLCCTGCGHTFSAPTGFLAPLNKYQTKLADC